MGRKSERERQKRQQRKRAKREARRSARRDAIGSPGGRESLAAERAAAACVAACQLLFVDCERLEEPVRADVVAAGRAAGGVWARLPFELEGFLLEGKPWTLTCRELEPAREMFEACGMEQAFSRLWSLALTNETDAARLIEQQDADCPWRAALAVQALRECLDEGSADPRRVVALIEREIEMHLEPSTPARAKRALVADFRRLLADAVASVRLPEGRRLSAVDALAARCGELLTRSAGEHAREAWWQCTRLFLAEVFDRHAAGGLSVDPARHPDLLRALLSEPDAALETARRTGSLEPLRTIHVQGRAQAWRRLLEERVRPDVLGFEDRIRYEVSRLKLQRAQALSGSVESGAASWLAAFQGLLALLSHGVPPASRAVPALVEPPLVDFYVESVERMDCAAAALPCSEALLRRHPRDFRLACLVASGAVARGAHHLLAQLKEHAPWAHVDAELFARCALRWVRAPKGRRAGAAVRSLLFDPLDREHRKQCLLSLGRLALRSSPTPAAHAEALRAIEPYLDRDSFVYRELRESAALEPGLVFLATQMAERHGLTLALTDAQSQQWVSHAREIAQQSAAGSRLALRYLRTPSRAFSLAREVRDAALARLGDFEPHRPPAPSGSPARQAEHAPGAGMLPRFAAPPRRKRAKAPTPKQRGLFDALDP